MALDPRTPVIVGVGQFLQRADDARRRARPGRADGEAVRTAAADARPSGCPASTRSASSAPVLALRRPGAAPRRTRSASRRPSTPTRRGRQHARRRSSTRPPLEILAGDARHRRARRRRGVAHAQRGRARPARRFDWPKAPEDRAAARSIGDELDMTHPAEAERGIYAARAGVPDVRDRDPRRGRARRPTSTWSTISELWSRFSAVAAGNPYAWSATRKSAEEIRTPAPNNRMIGLPLHEVHELEQRRRHGARRSSCARSRRPTRSACPRTAGCSRTPAPTATSTTFVSQPRHVRRDAGDRARRPAGARAGRRRHRRRRGHRPLLVLPVGRAARRAGARARRSTASSHGPAG